jgi:aryl-alcohol dehydrogenase-like predicted oxidoreductase
VSATPPEKRRIGSLEVSVVGLGCNNFGKSLDYDATAAVVHAALDAGINFLDTADKYGGTKSEEFIGRALHSRRADVIIATKFGSPIDNQHRGAKPEYVRRACDASLKRLATDHIDLYWLHRPDPSTPIADTLGALDELVRAGKVREIGCSNFSVDQIHEASSAVPPGQAHFVGVQIGYSLLDREPEHALIPECRRLGLSFIPFYPLASGLLSGKYRRGKSAPPGSRLTTGPYGHLLNDRNLEIVEALISFSAARGHTILELAISWLLRHDVVSSVIAGATTPDQVRANAASAGWKFTEEELEEIDAIVTSVELPDVPF